MASQLVQLVQQLKKAVDKASKDVKEFYVPPGAVNWGELRCMDGKQEKHVGKTLSGKLLLRRSYIMYRNVRK